VQGVVQAYDPATGNGVVLAEPDRTPVALRPGSLQGSIFRELRQGQRIVFEVVEEGGSRFAAGVRVGSDGY
jgi:cold shock CspA family protein